MFWSKLECLIILIEGNLEHAEQGVPEVGTLCVTES